MNVITQINDIVDKLNELDVYDSGLEQKLKIVDGQTQDILHYIEHNKINMLTCYNLIKKIKTIRVERRKIKEDIEILKRYNELKQKLISNVDNRKIVLAEIHKKEKQLKTDYKNRQFSEEDIQNILKGV